MPRLGAPSSTISSRAASAGPSCFVDGAPGLEKAIAAVWDGVPVQRVYKHRNLLAHAPERLHDEVTADYTDMIYAATREEVEVGNATEAVQRAGAARRLSLS